MARLLGWLAVILLALVVLTGYGITEYRTVDTITFGLLNKASSQRLHEWLDIPLLVVVGVHLGLVLWARRKRRAKG